MPEAAPTTGKTIADSEKVHQQCEELESDLAALKASYEQFFLGVERKPPNQKHDALKRKMNLLRNSFVRQTAAKFRVQNLAQKLATYERLWARTLKEMEDGTYRRDIFKAQLHAAKVKAEKKAEAAKKKNGELDSEDVDMSDDDDEVPSTPPDADANRGVQPHGAKPAPLQVGAPGRGASGPQVPAPGGRPSGPGVRVPVSGPMAAAPSGPRAPVAAQGDLSDQKMKAIYDAYVTAKKRCNEDVSKLSFDSLASTLRKQVPELIKQHKAKSVEFKVVIKDGKAILRALPK